MSGGSLPRPGDEAKSGFLELVPGDHAVTTRPMFGNMAAFVNGNMFAGLFGDDMFVRLADADRDELMKKGGRAFEPMAGRPMTGYVVLPGGWRRKAEASEWIARSLAFARTIPPKPAKKSVKKPATKPARG